MVSGMDEAKPDPETLKHRQSAQEAAELEALAGAEDEAEADKHARRADKARYLREKLEQQSQADRSAHE
jgi:tryptophan 2,3-dioxygenase